MTESKKEYLAWINLGICGTRWRADTVREAVEMCCIIVTQDFPGIRGETIRVAVYDVTEHDSVTLDGSQGEVLTAEETELPPLFIVEVDAPKIRKNGNAYGKPYQNKVQKAAYTALREELWKWREERVQTALEHDPMMQELLAEQAK